MESGTRRHWNYYRFLETLCVLDRLFSRLSWELFEAAFASGVAIERVFFFKKSFFSSQMSSILKAVKD